MTNKTRITTAAVVAALAAGGGLWFHQRAEAHDAPAYRTAAVERGTLKSTVSATGALSAVTTVQVGTQVSGQVAALYADFNDHVKKGQLLARIDPTLQKQAVQDAQAQLERAQAQAAQSSAEYARNKQLYDQKVITASEFGTVQSSAAVDAANVKSARIALQKAEQNLAYTNIHAPIDGVVVERDVDVGQTVAASLSAPQLFIIAQDLSQMQILASVDESDIGQIREGQPVSFTVQSYPSDKFTGTVKQVRLQSKTADNVVNYTAVVSVQNSSGKLLPGMTATVDFLTGQAGDALLVPNTALRFRATPEMLAAAGVQQGQWTSRRDSTGGTATGAPATGGTATAATGTRTRASSNRGTLWVLGKDGKVAPVRVQTGLSDGTKTAVTGQGLAAGMQVIIGSTTTSATTASTQGSSNPLQPQRPRGAGGPPPGGF